MSGEKEKSEEWFAGFKLFNFKENYRESKSLLKIVFNISYIIIIFGGGSKWENEKTRERENFCTCPIKMSLIFIIFC